jgi:hypothetical protein
MSVKYVVRMWVDGTGTFVVSYLVSPALNRRGFLLEMVSYEQEFALASYIMGSQTLTGILALSKIYFLLSKWLNLTVLHIEILTKKCAHVINLDVKNEAINVLMEHYIYLCLNYAYHAYVHSQIRSQFISSNR